MFKRITEALRKRRLRIARDEFNLGFDYAVGIAIRKERTLTSLKSHINLSPDSTQFDKGVHSAILRLYELGVISDTKTKERR